MKIVVVGAGYVGLVAGACWANQGHAVTLVDINEARICELRDGRCPIIEPGLKEMLRNTNLSFQVDMPDLGSVDFVVIAVGTPEGEYGEADISGVFEVARSLVGLGEHATVIIKSTVPPGTNRKVQKILDSDRVVSNPEFLQEAAAINAFIQPARVVIGSTNKECNRAMMFLYGADKNLLFMSPESAELSKYAANAMLAARISIMNAIASIADTSNANIDDVRNVVGSDPRIGPSFLEAGLGYGGSCFPKDVSALSYMYELPGTRHDPFNTISLINHHQVNVVIEKIGPVQGLTIAVWGIAFKPGTDDTRESPSIQLIGDLLRRGARVRFHDPAAWDKVRFGRTDWSTHSDRWSALKGADVLVIATAWPEYLNLTEQECVDAGMVGKRIVDARNCLNPRSFPSFDYVGVGR